MIIKEIRLERISASNDPGSKSCVETVLSPFDPNYNVLPYLIMPQKLMIDYALSFILGIIPESSPEMYFQSEPLLLDSKVTIVFHQFDRSRLPQPFRNCNEELTFTCLFQAGWHIVYSVNGLEYNLSEIEELRSVAHLGPLKYISPRRITGFMQMSSQQQLLYLEDAAGIGSLKKDLASKRQNLVELITREAGIQASLQTFVQKYKTIQGHRDIYNKWKAEVQRLKRLWVASEYYNLQVQETTLRGRLADLNKQTKTCQNNIMNTNQQIEALSKKLQEASAQESTLLEEDRRQTELYDFARLLSHNQCELTATSDLLSNGQEAEAYLQKRAEELGPAQVDANRRLTEERTKVDMLQETLDTLDAAVSKDVDTALPRATKKLKGEGPGKITKAVCLYYSSDGFHELIGKHKEKAKEMEKLRSSLSGFQKNFDLIQEESGDMDQKLKELGVKMKKWEKSVTSLSRTADDIKRKFPNLDLDLDKAKAAQIAARDKLRMVTDGNAKLLREILALKDKSIEGGKTETGLSVSVTETQSRLENLNSLMRSMIAKDPWISQEHPKFGKKNSSYDFKKDDPTKAREQAINLEREEKFNGIVVRSNINEMYERTLKEEGDLHADLKKIRGESSSCQQTISVLESKFRTSIAQLQRDFKAASSQMLPQHKLIELVMGEDHLDVNYDGGFLNLSLFDKKAHLTSLLLLLLSGNPNQHSVTFLNMVDATLDANDINLTKNALVKIFPNQQFIWISGKPSLHGIPVELAMKKPRALSLPSSQQGGEAALPVTM